MLEVARPPQNNRGRGATPHDERLGDINARRTNKTRRASAAADRLANSGSDAGARRSSSRRARPQRGQRRPDRAKRRRRRRGARPMSFGGRGLPDGSLGPSRSNRALARRRSALLPNRVGLSIAPFLGARLSVRLLRVDDDALRLAQEGPQLLLRFPRPSLPRAPFRLPIPATRRVRHPFEPRGGQSGASRARPGQSRVPLFEPALGASDRCPPRGADGGVGLRPREALTASRAGAKAAGALRAPRGASQRQKLPAP